MRILDGSTPAPAGLPFCVAAPLPPTPIYLPFECRGQGTTSQIPRAYMRLRRIERDKPAEGTRSCICRGSPLRQPTPRTFRGVSRHNIWRAPARAQDHRSSSRICRSGIGAAEAGERLRAATAVGKPRNLCDPVLSTSVRVWLAMCRHIPVGECIL